MSVSPALRRIAGVAALVAAAPAPPAAAQTFLTQDEALALAFPSADHVARRTAFLEDGQIARVVTMAGEGAQVPSGIVTHYVAYREGHPLGVAYFDAHRVRTLPETIMVVVGPDGRVGRVEVLRFAEPPEYVAPEGWLAQFDDRALGPALSLKGDIVNITGATLTSGAVTGAVRRVLALHAVIDPFEGQAP